MSYRTGHPPDATTPPTPPFRITVAKAGMFVIVRRFWPDHQDAYRMGPLGNFEHCPDHRNAWIGTVTVPSDVLDHFEWWERGQERIRKRHGDSDPGNPETWR